MRGERVTELDGVNALVTARNGLFLANRNDYYLGNALIRYGEYGELEWSLLKSFVEPDSTAVVVGASIGFHAISMARAVGSGGRVLAVEPQRIIFQYLCANVALNGLMNVETHHCGCSKDSGTLIVPDLDYLADAVQNFGGVSLKEGGPGETVQMRRLDDIIAGRTGVTLIKIHVEGMEADVIRGATATIRASRPVIYLENDQIDKSEELIRLISGLGYSLYWHHPPMFNPHNFFGEQENIYGDLALCNMLCLPEEKELAVTGLQAVEDPTRHPFVLSGIPMSDALELVRQHEDAGRFSIAESFYAQLLAQMPCSAETWKRYGNTLLSIGQLDKAEHACRRALELAPEYAEALNNLGIILRQKQRHTESEQAFCQALALMPESAEIRNNFGKLLMDSGRMEEAEQAFRKALVIRPDFAQACCNRGHALRELGRRELAEKCYRRAIDMNPDFVEAYVGLGKVLAMTGRRNEAEQALRRAISLGPDCAEAEQELGRLLPDTVGQTDL